MTNEKLFNLFGLAREMHLPVSWLKKEALDGRIPCLKVGRHLRFNKRAVEQALADIAAKGGENDVH
jgi:excisionase family DNA binding protein